MGSHPIKVEWSEPAKEDLNAIWEYYEVLIGFEKAEERVDRFFERAEGLAQFPEMGTIERDYTNAFITVRYLLESNYKIYYKVEGHVVKILRVFDTRQNPERLRNP